MPEVFAMVFCRECRQQVEDCAHFVAPLKVEPVEVFDPKVKTLAYQKSAHVLEITFKNGQVWQLFGIKPDIYDELLHATLSSFLNFLAHRYRAAPVRKASGERATLASEPCPACKRPMAEQHRTSGGILRILWKCLPCNQSLWRTYANESVRKRRRG
jgi:KTSC domain-containing protein